MAIWWLSWQPKLSNVNLSHNLSLFSISHQELTIKLKIKIISFSRSVVRDLDPTNELTFLRVKSLKYEVKSLNMDLSHIMVFKQKNEITDQRCWSPQSQTSWWLCFKAGMHNARTRIIRERWKICEMWWIIEVGGVGSWCCYPCVCVLPLSIMPLYAISMSPLCSHYNQSKLIVETTIARQDDNHTHCNVFVQITYMISTYSQWSYCCFWSLWIGVEGCRTSNGLILWYKCTILNKTVPNFCGQPTMIIIIIIYHEEFSINYYARRAISQW